MGDQALRDAAAAMTAMAAALTGGGEKNLINIEYFRGDGTQDPDDWFDEFRRAALANHWSATRKLELASVYLKGIAQDWYKNLANAPNVLIIMLMRIEALNISSENTSILLNKKQFGKRNSSKLNKEQTQLIPMLIILEN